MAAAEKMWTSLWPRNSSTLERAQQRAQKSYTPRCKPRDMVRKRTAVQARAPNAVRRPTMIAGPKKSISGAQKSGNTSKSPKKTSLPRPASSSVIVNTVHAVTRCLRRRRSAAVVGSPSRAARTGTTDRAVDANAVSPLMSGGQVSAASAACDASKPARSSRAAASRGESVVGVSAHSRPNAFAPACSSAASAASPSATSRRFSPSHRVANAHCDL